MVYRQFRFGQPVKYKEVTVEFRKERSSEKVNATFQRIKKRVAFSLTKYPKI